MALRWLVQQGIPVIPKSSNPVHIRSNFELFDFGLSSGEMQTLGQATAPAETGTAAHPDDAQDCRAEEEPPLLAAETEATATEATATEAAETEAAAPATTSNMSSTMLAVRTNGACGAPFTDCVHIASVPLPKPLWGEALIRVNASSVNPSDVDSVKAGGCTHGCGADFSGVVVSCRLCRRLKAGDAVWGLSRPAYSQYVASPEAMVSLRPPQLGPLEAATIPEVGLTSLFSLKRTGSVPGSPLPAGSPWRVQGTGSPWSNYSNLTVVVTAGSGGTGSVGIQLAKAWGARHIATATTGAGLAYVRSLGATYVTDYKQVDIFDSLPDNSVDIVYDNYGAEGTATKAMHAIRPGGVYLMVPHGECYEKRWQAPPCLAANPKRGVRQLNYATGPDFVEHAAAGLDELAALYGQGKLSTHIDKTFHLADVASAFDYSAGPGEGGVGSHIGKIALRIS